ncbi:TPA: mandelate racemase/muconate lactonizing enzyme family protein, partial [bacterium]|nr:mandelate racemase/muconate lactonizing enzyme family protein [bacterium]
MKVTKVEVIRSKEPIQLPEPWLASWNSPDGTPITSMGFSFYKVHTDEGIVGIGPDTGFYNPSILIGFDPFMVGDFWSKYMSGRRAGHSGYGASGLEIALWDIMGKATNQPIYKLLGGGKDKIFVYAATSRLLTIDQHIKQVQDAMDEGFKAIKLRLHRPNPWDDVAVVEAVCETFGDKMMILVDANQNNPSNEYQFWSRQTALRVAKKLDELGVYYLEEPLRLNDIDGLAEIANSVDMFIAGGEHAPTIYDYKEHILKRAYDIIQPDAVMGGNTGITGLKRIANIADYFGVQVVPH